MAHSVSDFVDLLTALTEQGFDYSVIGGCAVGASEGDPRDRQAPARRYLEVLGQQTLPPHVADALIPLARATADFRFLLSRVDGRDRAEAVFERAAALGIDDPDLAAIAEARGFQRRR